MNIFITLDYELFFGHPSGSPEQCMLRPTRDLLAILDKYQIKISFFVDSGYLIALDKFKSEFPQLEVEYEAISKQIRQLADDGHGIELHVHPHWEDSHFDGDQWNNDTSRYKLGDFNPEQVNDIISRHCQILGRISGIAPVAYRAGGWCVQPFQAIGEALASNSITIDSTVYPGGFYASPNQVYDFRKTPRFNTHYSFSEDPAILEPNGKFTEIPISSIWVSPIFYWKFAMKKLFPSKQHVAYGDGNAISMPRKEKIRLLTTPSYSVVSMDGYKASLLQKAIKTYANNAEKDANFVIIGHPKAFTSYALNKLKLFIEATIVNHEYQTFRNYANNG